MSPFAGLRPILTDRRVHKFVLTGLLNTVFGYSVYAGLVYCGSPYHLALLIATIAGVIFNYFSFGSIVFGTRASLPIFVKFVVAYAVVYCINVLGLRTLTDTLQINPYAAQAICVPLNVALSWLLMNHWVYRKE